MKERLKTLTRVTQIKITLFVIVDLHKTPPPTY